jgi:hypothetical protein
MMTASLSALSLVALVVGAAAVLLVLGLVLFVWLDDGRYAESLLARATRIRWLRRRVLSSYVRDLEKTNPVAARAYAKVERVSGVAARRHTEAALSVLTTEERAAYLDLFGMPQSTQNRAQRRRAARPGARRPPRQSR